MGLVGVIFHRFMSRQSLFYKELSPTGKKKLAEIENRYAELRVTGPEGGVFYFQYKHLRLQPLESKPDVPDEQMDRFQLVGDDINYSGGDDVLLDVIDGELSPREVHDEHYFRTKTIYDSEEFIQAFENFLREIQRVFKPRGKR